jgi:hypothetical protein
MYCDSCQCPTLASPDPIWTTATVATDHGYMIWDTLLVQHYATRLAERDRVTMVSDASRAYLMHTVAVDMGVIWEMQISPGSVDTSRFRCTIDVDMPAPIRVLGLFNGTAFFVHGHLIEETDGFARDIARQYKAAH